MGESGVLDLRHEVTSLPQFRPQPNLLIDDFRVRHVHIQFVVTRAKTRHLLKLVKLNSLFVGLRLDSSNVCDLERLSRHEMGDFPVERLSHRAFWTRLEIGKWHETSDVLLKLAVLRSWTRSLDKLAELK